MNRYIWPMLQQIDTWLLVAASISVLFFFFAIKFRFSKTPSVKSYALFFYAFIFYSISAISFVVLNAMHRFLNLQDGFYSESWWFFPINILSAFIGFLVALLIYHTALKVAEPFTFKLLNGSLVIISLALLFTLLVQPIQETFQRVLSYHQPAPKPIAVNKIQVSQIHVDTFNWSLEAMPAQFFDSLQISYSNRKIKVLNPANGFMFHVTPLVQPIEQLYVLPIPALRYVAILALPPRLQSQSAIMLVDSMGVCVFNQSFNTYYNQVGLNPKDHTFQLNTRTLNDSLELGVTFKIN